MGCFHWTTDISVGLCTLSYRGVDHGGLRSNEVVAVDGAPCTPRTPGGCLDHAWGGHEQRCAARSFHLEGCE